MRMKRAFFIVLFVLMFGAVWCEDVYNYESESINGTVRAIYITKGLDDKFGEYYEVQILEVTPELTGEKRITYFNEKKEALMFAYENKKAIDNYDGKTVIEKLDELIKKNNLKTYEDFDTFAGGILHTIYFFFESE